MVRILRIALAAWTATFVISAPIAWAQSVPSAPKPLVEAKAIKPLPVKAAAPVVVAVPAAPAVPVVATAPKPLVEAAQVATPAPVTLAAPVVAPVPVAADQVGTPPPPPPAPPQPPGPSQPPQPAQAPKLAAPVKPPAAPQPPPPPANAPESNMNVRVEVTIIDQSGAGPATKKTVSVTVRDEGSGSVRSGVTVPIPSGVFTPTTGKEGETKPATSFSYRDMGLSLDVRQAVIRGNYVRLRLAVEYNPVDEKMASIEGPTASMLAQGPASFARFSQTLELALENGKPLIVASSSDPVPSRNRTASLEVKATILK